MKVEIVQVWRNRYAERRLSAMVPPLTSLHLAALVPPDVEVAVRHEKVTPIDYEPTPTSWRSRSSPASPAVPTRTPMSCAAGERRW